MEVGEGTSIIGSLTVWIITVICNHSDCGFNLTWAFLNHRDDPAICSDTGPSPLCPREPSFRVLFFPLTMKWNWKCLIHRAAASRGQWYDRNWWHFANLLHADLLPADLQILWGERFSGWKDYQALRSEPRCLIIICSSGPPSTKWSQSRLHKYHSWNRYSVDLNHHTKWHKTAKSRINGGCQRFVIYI